MEQNSSDFVEESAQLRFKDSETAAKKELPQSVSWIAPEYGFEPKSPRWFLAAFLVGALLIAAMIWMENYTAAAFFGLAVVLIAVYAKKEPSLTEFGVGSSGIRIGDRIYEYADLRSFWIFYDKTIGRSELSLRSRKVVMPYIRVPLESINPAVVHAILSKYLPERRHSDSVSDVISQQIGF
jgi:hypothetical protein